MCDPSPFKQLLGLQLDDLISLQPWGFASYTEVERALLLAVSFFLSSCTQSGRGQLLNKGAPLTVRTRRDVYPFLRFTP